MFKLTLFLCLGLFICSANAGFGDNVKDAAKKVQDIIGKAIEQVTEQTTNALDKVKDVTDQILKKAYEIVDKVKATVKDVLKKITSQIDRAVEEAKQYDIDVSECTKQVESITEKGDLIADSVSKCIEKKINSVEVSVETVRAKSDKALNELGAIRTESEKCIENVDSWTGSIKAFACVNIAAAKASFKAYKEVPSIVKQIAKLSVQISSTPASLPACAFSDAIREYVVEAKQKAEEIQECIQEKIANRPVPTEAYAY